MVPWSPSAILNVCEGRRVRQPTEKIALEALAFRRKNLLLLAKERQRSLCRRDVRGILMCYSVARDGTRDSVLALGRSGSFLRGISGAPFPFRCSRPRRRTVPRSAERLPPQVVGGEWTLTVGRVPRAPGSVTSLSVSENGTRILGPGGFFRPVRLKERKLEESTRIQNKVIFTQVWPNNLSARVCCHGLGGRAPRPPQTDENRSG